MPVPRPSTRSIGHLVFAALVLAAPACAKKPEAAGSAGEAGAAAPAPPQSAPPAAPASAPPSTAPSSRAGTAPPPGGAPDRGEEILDEAAIPDVVARIDGVPISKSDLLARATEARGALAQRGTPLPPLTRAFYRRVLDDVIGNRLLHRDLTAQGKAATPEEIAAGMQAIRTQFASDAELDKALAERGFDRARLERDVAEGVSVRKWLEREVIPSVTVSAADVRAFYDANPERMVEPERVHARHILIRVDAQARAEQKAAARRRLEEIRARLAGGADFAALAQESSDDKGSGARGGDLGWFYRGQMVPAFEQAAFSLPPHELSEVVETRFGFHLLEVLERRPETRLAFEQVAGRLESMLRQRQLDEKVKARVNELGARATIEILL
jgi:peptidyl-prolyl cis-trans isomerase C